MDYDDTIALMSAAIYAASKGDLPVDNEETRDAAMRKAIEEAKRIWSMMFNHV